MRKPIAKQSVEAFIGGVDSSAQTSVAVGAATVNTVVSDVPTLEAVESKPKRTRRYTQTSVSWTADYDTLIEDAIFEAMGQRIRANKSHVVRAAMRALEKLNSAERIKLIQQVIAE